MAVSNSIGSNTFDILICLGLPWMIRAIATGVQSDIWIVKVQSEALTYTVISLLISLIILYSILLASRFLLSRTLGVVCLVIYCVFLTISLLFELNVFYDVNPPTCHSKYSWKDENFWKENDKNQKSICLILPCSKIIIVWRFQIRIVEKCKKAYVIVKIYPNLL